MTLLETLQADYDKAKAELLAKGEALDKLKAEAGDFLSREVSVIEGWVRAVASHLFHGKPAEPLSPVGEPVTPVDRAQE